MKDLMNSMFDQEFISAELLADIVSVSKSTLNKWEKNGRLKAILHPITNRKLYPVSQLGQFPEIQRMRETKWDEEIKIKPIRNFLAVELFAGAGGLALGLEKAGFITVALNELDKDCCHTLKLNRPEWSVIQADARVTNFTQFTEKFGSKAPPF